MASPAESSRRREEDRTPSPSRSSSSRPSKCRTAAERLTDDLLVEVLSRVPAKSLCRFKCVSNHWLSVIDHPDHRKKLPQTLTGFFHGSSNLEDWILESPVLFTSVSPSPPMDTSFAFLPNHQQFDLLDSCYGLLLCRLYNVSAEVGKCHYVVCNPATEKWVLLPDSGQDSVNACLGFNPALSSHFHVFELVEEQDNYISGVAVYSSETGVWVYKENRWNKRVMLIELQPSFVFLNGYLHFQVDGHDFSRYLAVVDTDGETWMNFSVPGGLLNGFIQHSQGRLHYANFQRDEHGGVFRLVVYVLENYQSKEWTLKHSVETSYILGRTDYCIDGFDWIAIHPECNLIFFTIGQELKLMCYNMDRRQLKVICNLEGVTPPYLSYVPLYAELEALHI
ncbi:hypothetical protein CFC21_111170 [Triticum aestivum]|nr:F-box protein At5g07610-like [Aegilops tauschii subsp. strangulata]XP_044440053.1 F-box protein At5g07610-like [Triticum aestivum]KAF7111124.1 hypothetical protein CFC21_111170 [Triticum aestivum]